MHTTTTLYHMLIIQDLWVDSLLMTNKSGSQILVAEETFTSLSVSYIEHK